MINKLPVPPSPDGLTAQDHDWADKDDPRMAQWPSLRASMTYACCLRCGVVKRADGKNKPCVGKMPRIGLREQPPDGPTERRGSNGERRQRIEALARKVCDRIEKGEISIGRMSEITGLTHQELMMLHAASGGETPPAPTASRPPCSKCGHPHWKGPQYTEREPWSSYPEAMADRRLHEALMFQCRACGWCDYAPLTPALAASSVAPPSKLVMEGLTIDDLLPSDPRQTGTPSGGEVEFGTPVLCERHAERACLCLVTPCPCWCHRVYGEAPRQPDGPSPRRGSDEPLESNKGLSVAVARLLLSGEMRVELKPDPVASPWTFSEEETTKVAERIESYVAQLTDNGDGWFGWSADDGAVVAKMLREGAALRSEVERLYADNVILSTENRTLAGVIERWHEDVERAYAENVKVVELEEKVERLTQERDTARSRYMDLVKADSADYHDQLTAAHTIASLHSKVDVLKAEHARLTAQLKAVIEAEQGYRESERIALRRLSAALTGGNAGQWEEIFHAAEQLNAKIAADEGSSDVRPSERPITGRETEP